ncbi:ABC transporter substrate-binding protein [Micromonospora echinospora]|uniref:ABC transporter substrate-binding protein n=1 Tax=Micromonospora echinospora TaxID=1877 RepID=UPI00366B4B0C
MSHRDFRVRAGQASGPARWTGLCAGAVAITIAVSGCGFVGSGNDASKDGSGTVSAYVSTEQGTGLTPLVEAFEKESGLTLSMKSAPTADLNEQLRVQLTSGTAADVFRVSPGFSSPVAVGALGSQGELADLSKASWTGSMNDSIRQMSSVDGKVFAFPIGQNAIVMAFNKSVFQKAGVQPPTTWSELLAACEKLQAAGVTPISAGFTGGVSLQFWVYALAASLVYGPDPQLNDKMLADEVNFADHPAWTTVFQKILDLKKYMTPQANGVSIDQSTADVAQGRAAMQLMVSSSLPGLFSGSAGGAADFDVFALPATDDASSTRLPVAPDFLAVKKDAPMEDVEKLLGFLAKPENVKQYAEKLGVLPGLDVASDAKVDALAPVLPLAEGKRTTAFANYLWPNGSTQQRMLQSGQQLIAGEIKIPALLAQMDAEFDKGTP